jgi:hypothetical protein
MTVKLPYFADQANLVVVDDTTETKEGPPGETSLQLLQTVYRDRKQPLNVRVRCAVEALAHEYPKLSATAHVNYDFAKELEKALERAWGRSANANVPRLNGSVPQLDASEMKKPFSKLNYRRF